MSKRKLYRFEKIMEYYPYENYKSFSTLLEWFQKEKKDIFCYVGTGLSFYFKSWGEPFQKIVNEQFVNFIEKDQRDLFIQKIEEELYLEVGNQLDIIARDKTRWTSKDKKESGERTFNHFFLEALENRKKLKNSCDMDEKSIKNGHLPKETVFLIPYIGVGNCITTNCDDSIEIAFKKANKSCYSHVGKNAGRNWQRNIDNVTHIFYIHGRYDDANSLIMIKDDYDEIYGSPNKPADSFNVRFLKEIAQRKHMIFLGASLEGDTTYEIIKKDVRHNPADTGENIAFLCPKSKDKSFDPNIKKYKEAMQSKMAYLIGNMSVRPLFVPQFSCYPVVLCEAIREAESANWNQESCRCKHQRKKICLDLIEKMEKNTAFERYDTSTLFYSEKDVNWTLSRFLYDNQQRKPGWTICRVNSSDFTFPSSKPFDPRYYNAPLGNTIYFIGGDHMFHNQVETIVEKIRLWTESHKKDFYEGIKVRVIVYSSPLSPLEMIHQELFENRKLNDENIELNIKRNFAKGNDYVSEIVNNIRKIKEDNSSLKKQNEVLRVNNEKIREASIYDKSEYLNKNIDFSAQLHELTNLTSKLIVVFEKLDNIQAIDELRDILQELKTILMELRTRVFSLGKEKTLTLNLSQFESQYNDRKAENEDE